MGEIASFGTTTRWRFSAYQTLEFSNRLTFTLSLSSELKFTLATKKYAISHLCHHPLNTLGIVSYSELRSSPAHRTNWLFFEKIIFRTLAQGLPGATLAKSILNP